MNYMDIVYEDFIPERVAQLRKAKGVSARDMSLSIGQNPSYINRIENKRNLPSLCGLLYICDYLKITPRQFFDVESQNPAKLNAIIADLEKLDGDALAHIAGIVQSLAKK